MIFLFFVKLFFVYMAWLVIKEYFIPKRFKRIVSYIFYGVISVIIIMAFINNVYYLPKFNNITIEHIFGINSSGEDITSNTVPIAIEVYDPPFESYNEIKKISNIQDEKQAYLDKYYVERYNES